MYHRDPINGYSTSRCPPLPRLFPCALFPVPVFSCASFLPQQPRDDGGVDEDGFSQRCAGDLRAGRVRALHLPKAADAPLRLARPVPGWLIFRLICFGAPRFVFLCCGGVSFAPSFDASRHAAYPPLSLTKLSPENSPGKLILYEHFFFFFINLVHS